MVTIRFIFIGLIIGALHLSVICSQSEQAKERQDAMRNLEKALDGCSTLFIQNLPKMISDLKAEVELQQALNSCPSEDRWQMETICRLKPLPTTLR